MKLSFVFTLLLAFSTRLFGQNSPAIDNEKVLDYIQSQRFGEAAEYIKSVYPGKINDDKITARLGYLYYMNGNLPEAEKNYLTLLQKDTLNINILLNLASINNRRGNYMPAIKYYKKVISIDSTIFNVFKQLAAISDLAEDSNTVYYLRKANVLNPSDGDVAYDLSDSYIKAKKYEEADSILDIAIKADTTNLLLYRAKAHLEYARNHYKDLVKICEKLRSNGDQSFIVLKWLGEGYYFTKSYQKSMETFLLLPPEEFAEGSLYMLAKDYKYLKDDKKSIEYFKKTIEAGISISKNINSYYYEIGDSYTSLKQSKNALTAYQKSIGYGASPITYYRMALLYDLELKNKSSALKYYRKFVASSSENDALQEHYIYSKARITELTR